MIGTETSEKSNYKTKSGEKYIISFDPEYYRRLEIETLLGAATKAHKQLGWITKSNIDQLIKEKVDSDMILAGQE